MSEQSNGGLVEIALRLSSLAETVARQADAITRQSDAIRILADRVSALETQQDDDSPEAITRYLSGKPKF